MTREDLAGCTDEAGTVPASAVQNEPDSEMQFVFGKVSGLSLICFVTPDETGEGRCMVSEVDEGFSEAGFDVSDDGSTVKMDASVNVVPGQEEELCFVNPVFRTLSGQVFAALGTV